MFVVFQAFSADYACAAANIFHILCVSYLFFYYLAISLSQSHFLSISFYLPLSLSYCQHHQSLCSRQTRQDMMYRKIDCYLRVYMSVCKEGNVTSYMATSPLVWILHMLPLYGQFIYIDTSSAATGVAATAVNNSGMQRLRLDDFVERRAR